MSEKAIEHNAVYYSAKYDKILIGEVTLNDWSVFGCGVFWSYRLVCDERRSTREFLVGLIKIGDLYD